jgi:hypothetical protein
MLFIGAIADIDCSCDDCEPSKMGSTADEFKKESVPEKMGSSNDGSFKPVESKLAKSGNVSPPCGEKLRPLVSLGLNDCSGNSECWAEVKSMPAPSKETCDTEDAETAELKPEKSPSVKEFVCGSKLAPVRPGVEARCAGLGEWAGVCLAEEL